MNKTEIDDDMLMALADGEIAGAEKAALERAVLQDSALRARFELFRTTRRSAREAFADVLTEPVPQNLIDGVLHAPSAHRPRWTVPLAAALALAAAMGGYFLTQKGDASMTAMAERAAEALTSLPSGQAADIGNGIVAQADGSFRTASGICRIIDVRGPESFRSVSCTDGDGWRVQAMARAGEEQYQPAAGNEALDAFLDGVAAGPALDEEAERALMAKGWRD